MTPRLEPFWENSYNDIMTSCGHLEEPTLFPLGFHPEGDKAPLKGHHPKEPQEGLLIGQLGPLLPFRVLLHKVWSSDQQDQQQCMFPGPPEHFNKSPGDLCPQQSFRSIALADLFLWVSVKFCFFFQ